MELEAYIRKADLFQAAMDYGRREACDDPAFVYRYARCLETGVGIGQDRKEARELYQEAADWGCRPAAERLAHWDLAPAEEEALKLEAIADCCALVMHMDPEPEQAEACCALLEYAAQQGCAEAYLPWAECLDEGKWVPRHQAAAFVWYEKAAMCRSSTGRAEVVRRVREMDPEQQAAFRARYEELAEAGEPWPQVWLGLDDDLASARKWLGKAAAQGDPDAVYLLFHVCEREDLPESAFPMLLDAARSGHRRAMFQVARCYGWVTLAERDEDEAMKWYERAAWEECPAAAYLIGRMAEEDDNLYMAQSWFEMAVDHEEAAEGLYGCPWDAEFFGLDESDRAAAWYHLGLCRERIARQEPDADDADRMYGAAVDAYQEAWDRDSVWGHVNASEAAYRLALCYEYARGVAHDGEKVRELMEDAAGRGCQEAEEFLWQKEHEEEEEQTLTASSWKFQPAIQEEAVKRLRILENMGMDPAADRFERDGTFWFSVNDRHGIHVLGEGRYLKAIRAFEKRTGCVAYFAVNSQEFDGYYLSVFYVSNDPREWAGEREDLKRGRPMVYVETFPLEADGQKNREFGTISISVTGGGVSRWQ